MPGKGTIRIMNWKKTGKAIAAAAFAAGTAASAAVVLAAPGKKAGERFAPFADRNVAHRGLYAKDQAVPENSLTAFELAAESGYGIELDVQLSRDGRVVVFHDDDLKRVCDVDAPVDALTFQELRALGLCGTDEKIPLFAEVLALVGGRVPLIVELKSGRNNRLLCEKTLALLANYRGEYCVESFDPFIMGWFRRHAPQLVRGQLACPADAYARGSAPLRFALSRCLLNVVSRPQFIAYQVGPQPRTVKLAERLGAKKVCWTSHDPENERIYDTVIFEHYRPQVWYNKQ